MNDDGDNRLYFPSLREPTMTDKTHNGFYQSMPRKRKNMLVVIGIRPECPIRHIIKIFRQFGTITMIHYHHQRKVHYISYQSLVPANIFNEEIESWKQKGLEVEARLL